MAHSKIFHNFLFLFSFWTVMQSLPQSCPTWMARKLKNLCTDSNLLLRSPSSWLCAWASNGLLTMKKPSGSHSVGRKQLSVCRGDYQGELGGRGGERRNTNRSVTVFFIYWLFCCFVLHFPSECKFPEDQKFSVLFFLISPTLSLMSSHGRWSIIIWWKLLNTYRPETGPWKQIAVQP